MTQPQKPAQLSKDTLISGTLATSILILALSAAWWLKGTLDDIQYTLKDVRAHLAVVETRQHETWGLNEQFLFQYELHKANPGMTIPDAKAIREKAGR
jgi:hypothetical protein